VRTDRNIVTGEMLDDFHLVVAALELDHHCATFLHQPHGVIECLSRFGVAHERHVRDKKCSPQATGHRARVIDNVIDSDRHSRVVPLDYHAERITNQDQVRPGRIDQDGIARVVGGEAGNRLTVFFHLAQGGDINRGLRHAALFKLGVHEVRPVRRAPLLRD